MGFENAWRNVPLGQLMDFLEEERAQAADLERSAGHGAPRRPHQRTQDVCDSHLMSLRRVAAYLREKVPPGGTHLSVCPLCGRPVAVAEDAPWVCPTKVRHDAPGWVPMPDLGLPGGASPDDCGHDYGLACYPMVPVHRACAGRS